MARLEVQDVAFAWPGRPVLRGVSFALEGGELVAVVGPNGAGKSTLLGVLSGRLAPERGSVRLDGTDLHGMDRRAAARRIAGVAAEEDAAFPFTVRDTVALGRHPWRGAFGRPTPEDEARVATAIHDADLHGLEDRPLPGLSSGERQRARIARCLAQGGEIVLLDEPTAYLDLGHAQRVLRTFRRHARRDGAGVLAVLHDLNLAGAFADRVLLLVDGRIEAAGTPREVLTAERVARAFGAAVRIVGGDRPSLVSEPDGEAADA